MYFECRNKIVASLFFIGLANMEIGIHKYGLKHIICPLRSLQRTKHFPNYNVFSRLFFSDKLIFCIVKLNSK